MSNLYLLALTTQEAPQLLLIEIIEEQVGESNLVSVNLHDQRPSSISTPKIFHVAENEYWFKINEQRNLTTFFSSEEITV